jgi:pSer/pThr/pTyr-binding forkhead associated (FHA) protein
VSDVVFNGLLFAVGVVFGPQIAKWFESHPVLTSLVMLVPLFSVSAFVVIRRRRADNERDHFIALATAVLSGVWLVAVVVAWIATNDLCLWAAIGLAVLLAAARLRTRQIALPRLRPTAEARFLVVTAGTLAGARLMLSDQPVTIGRSKDSTLVITDDYASPHHARLVPRSGHWLVEDLNSNNGTYLDRTRVTAPTPVPLGVPIRIGLTCVELRSSELRSSEQASTTALNWPEGNATQHTVRQQYERLVGTAVNRRFQRLLKGTVHPIDILESMQRSAKTMKQRLAHGRTVAPNRYVIYLSPYDHGRFRPYARILAQELARSQAEFIQKQGWAVYGDIVAEIELASNLGKGRYKVTAEVRTDSQVSPSVPDQPASVPDQPASAPDQPVGGARLVGPDGQVYVVPVGSLVIGRSDQVDIRIPDVGVSKRHARIDFNGTMAVIQDLGSTNGTSVNGQRVAELPLTSGDVIQIGTTKLIYR